MLRTERMQKVRIIALDHMKYDIVKALHELGVMEIRRSGLELSDDRALDQFPDISTRLVRFEGALNLLSEPKRAIEHIKFDRHMSLEQLLHRCDSLRVINEIFALNDERKALKEDSKTMDEALVTARLFDGTDVDFGRLSSNALEFRAVITGSRNAERIRSHIENRMIRSETIEKRLPDRELLLFIAYERSRGKDFDDIIKESPHQEIDLSNKYLNSTSRSVIEHMERSQRDSGRRLSEIENRLGMIGRESYHDIAGLIEMLEIEYERASITTNFKRTGRTFIIEGWVPRQKLKHLSAEIKKVTGGRFEIEEIHDRELAPTLINRPGFLRPFDYLMEFFSLPRSDEIDPTYIFIISLAVFYGLTVSDVGYGLLSLALAYIISRRTDPLGLLHNVAKVWMMFSISIIFFGIISNQFFGFSVAQFSGFKVFDWLSNIKTLILLTIFIGVTQVSLGQVFSFVNHWHHKERKLAISKLVSLFAIGFGIVAIGGWFFGTFPSSITMPATIVAVASIIVTAVLSGIEAGEITNLISHPLSYIRLFGFGLASVIIASLIDKTLTPNPSQGIPIFILYLILFIALHLMNMLLSIFEGIVQSARLNFVEFFSKFYRGNGVKFRPYYYKRRYTKV